MDSLLPLYLQSFAHIKAYEQAGAQQLAETPIEKLLVYFIDTVDEAVLPYLAAQFDVLGVKGYKYATTVAQKRAVIQNAIRLHRRKGTVQSIIDALLNINLVVNNIEEGVGYSVLYDGTFQYDGTQTYGSFGHWAFFRVWLNSANNTVIDAGQIADALEIIKEFKPARCRLFDITVNVVINDTTDIEDTILLDNQIGLSDAFGGLYNGLFQYDGTLTYSNISDFVRARAARFDADSLAFITAAGITDFAEQDAIGELVADLKAEGIWAKMHAIYPMVGSSANAHKYNLKDPADTDPAYRLTFAGGWTHSQTGALPNGTNAIGDTHYVPATNGNLTSQHISYYSRTTFSGGGADMGAVGTTGNVLEGQLFVAPNSSDNFYSAANNTNKYSHAVAIDSKGYFIISRTDATTTRSHRNATLLYSDTGNANTISDFSVYLGAVNEQGTAVGHSSRECAFATIGEGLSPAEAITLNTIVQVFQTSLNRNV